MCVYGSDLKRCAVIISGPMTKEHANVYASGLDVDGFNSIHTSDAIWHQIIIFA